MTLEWMGLGRVRGFPGARQPRTATGQTSPSTTAMEHGEPCQQHPASSTLPCSCMTAPPWLQLPVSFGMCSSTEI
ncbi:hypothetical protein IHE44_0014764 [Lamprotornis superbus]|uniref:Uncharacterized protein n=1 Tax=Lamprotornis superbus TaxID=245042 RepID=A0A835NKU9_9PASS|nr:hypothetical protein IHE44_0014764 [Lamprotornis superbus]